MQKFLFPMIIGVLIVTMMMTGCAQPGAKSDAMDIKDEPMESSSDIGEPVPDSGTSGIGESDLSSERAGRDDGMSGAGLSTILFDFDQFNIREDMRSVMKSNAEWLSSHPDVKTSIEGHADERGTNEYNLALGERRAKAATRYLVSLGVDQSRLSTISYGEERPSCRDMAENCYSQNRRAQFKLQ